MMEGDHLCGKCHNHFAELDPHSICKKCRQPNPEMFYCNEEFCQPCNEIKAFKPLENLLHKYEYRKITKKFSIHLNSPSKPNDQHLSYGTDRYCLYPSSSNKNSTFPPNDEDNLSNLERRFFDKFISTLSKSEVNYNLDKKSNEEKTLTNASYSKEILIKIENINNSLMQENTSCFSESEEKYTAFLKSFFKAIESDLFVKQESNIGDSEDIIRLSSNTSTVLQTSTLLSSPSCATKLVEFSSNQDADTWPEGLKISNLPSLSSEKIKLKAHPKVRQMQTILFGKLEPSLPKKIISSNFSLPSIPLQLQHQLNFARSQLHRLILIFSILDNFLSLKNSELNVVVRTFLKILQCQIELTLINQANFLGLLIQEVRKNLLKYAVCKDPDAISKLITGAVHSSQFFGPYVFELQKTVELHGPAYCIKYQLKEPIIKVPKIPVHILENEENPTKFIDTIEKFFVTDNTVDSDKVRILKFLIPQTVLTNIENVSPSKNMTYEELVCLFKRYGNKSSEFLNNRLTFKNRVQFKGESTMDYGQSLFNLISVCSYGILEKELLRDQFIFGLHDEKIRTILIEKPFWSFEECLDYTSHLKEVVPKKEIDISKKRKRPEEPLEENINISLPENEQKKRKSFEEPGRKSLDFPKKKTPISIKRKSFVEEPEKKSVEFPKKKTPISIKRKRSEEPEEKKFIGLPYHEFLNFLCGEQKHIEFSNYDLWKQIFPKEDSQPYQIVCPFTGRLLRE